MSVSPYTLNNLYNQGIIDYAPYDLAGGMYVSSLNAMQNPYMNMAMSGAMYQNYGMYGDSFTPMGYSNIGQFSNAGMNAYGTQGIGTYSQAGMNAFGVSGIGTHSNAGMNAYGGGVKEFGMKTWNFFQSIPTTIKGLLAGGLIVGTAVHCLKKGKKPPVQQNKSFIDKFKNFFGIKKKNQHY